jgi:hypothetical protein
MAEKRRADAFAGKESFADKLRKQRMAIEDGDPSGGREMFIEQNDDNRSKDILDRGYKLAKDEQ